VLIESKAIGNREVDIYMSSRYRLTTIIPLRENPVMNVYLFTKEELDHFLGVCRRTPNNFIDSVDCSLKIEKS
jgi:hypothetical protein